MLVSTDKKNRWEINFNLFQPYFIVLALCMVALLPVLFFHCYAKKVDIETQQGSKSFQGKP